MLFNKEKILILHPGKCGGTTIEHLFLRALRRTNLAQLLNQPCFKQENNHDLTAECLQQRKEMMAGYISRVYAINGVYNIYLQHADLAATGRIHGQVQLDGLFKIAFVRNPFPRILSAYYYNMWDRKTDFRTFIIEQLPRRKKMNQDYTRNHFGALHHYTHMNGRLAVDFLGKLETLAEDVDRLSRQLGLSLDLQRERQHARTRAGRLYAHYSQAYDDQMVAVVQDLYAQDLQLFDYQFERRLPYGPVPLGEDVELAANNGRHSFLSAFRQLFGS